MTDSHVSWSSTNAYSVGNRASAISQFGLCLSSDANQYTNCGPNSDTSNFLILPVHFRIVFSMPFWYNHLPLFILTSFFFPSPCVIHARTFIRSMAIRAVDANCQHELSMFACFGYVLACGQLSKHLSCPLSVRACSLNSLNTVTFPR